MSSSVGPNFNYLFQYQNRPMPAPRDLCVCDHTFTPDRKCQHCGSYQHSHSVLKTAKYASPFHFNLRHYLKHLRTNSAPLTQPKEIAEDTFALLTSICDKFVFTEETLALGLHIYQTLHRLSPHEKFWASTCLIIAGKAGELDKNVPYLNRYQRYADKSFSQADYEQAERTIFEAMNFEVQYSTFITFLDFYLTCGVVFEGEGLSSNLVEFFEDDILITARQFLKKGAFTRYKPELLALSIIKETRKKYSLPLWNSQLTQLSSYTEEQVLLITLTQESPLKQLSHNSLERIEKDKAVDLKYGLLPRRNYEFTGSTLPTTLKGDRIPDRIDKIERPFCQKPLLEKYSSISKTNASTLKQNSYSSSKAMFPAQRKGFNFLAVEGFSSVSSDLMKRR